MARLLQNRRRRRRLLIDLSLASLAIVTVLAFLVARMPVLALDIVTTREIQEITGGGILRLMVAVSLPGYAPWSALTVGIGALTLGLWLGWRDGLYLLAITALQGLINAGIKLAIGRPRPLDKLVEVFAPVVGNSFPSGHVMFYTVFFGFIFFLAWTRLPRSLLRALALVLSGGLVLLIGPSRIYLGAHWFSDVVAAHLIGLIILAAAVEGHLSWPVFRRPPPPPGP
jgi:undecaprenyl-diphosphatase